MTSGLKITLLAECSKEWGKITHPLHEVKAININTATGKILSPSELFGYNLPQAKQAIYDQLIKMDGIFAEEVEKLKGKFITDTECNSCNLLVTPEGVKVIFNEYAVVPYAFGRPEVLLPKEHIADQAVLESLKK